MKKVVLLINPSHDREGEQIHSSPHRVHRDIPPMSILTLGSYLRQKGVDVIIFDTHIDSHYSETLAEYFKQFEIILVGMTTFVGRFIHNAIELGNIIKGLKPEVPIVWGGPLVSTLPEKCLREGNADYVVLYEGEMPLYLLAQALTERKPVDGIPNLGYRKNGELRFTRVDYAAERYDGIIRWDLLSNPMNRQQIPYVAYLFTSRGCPYSCSFCYHLMDSNSRIIKKYACRSAEQVLEEIDFLRDRYQINVVSFGDDNFLAEKKRVLKILEGVRKRGLYIEQCVGTFSDLNEEVIEALSGICQTVICSIETASERLSKFIKKPINLRTVDPTVQKLADHGINTYHNFMFGLPGETDEDRKRAVDLGIGLKKINAYVRLIPSFFTPLPGTPIYCYLETSMGISVNKSLKEWGDCEFIGCPDSYKFRPWISAEEQSFLAQMIDLFRDFFVSLNSPVNNGQKARIESYPRLRYIFQNMDKVAYPPDGNPKYLLDKILGGDAIGAIEGIPAN